MAADVHVDEVISWSMHSAVPAAAGWRFLLPFFCILAVCFVWFWLPKLLVGLLTRTSRRYVKKIGSGSAEFAVNSAGKHSADRSAVFGLIGNRAACPDGEAADCPTMQSNNTLWLFWLRMRAVLRLLLLWQ